MWISKKLIDSLDENFGEIIFQIGGLICILSLVIGGVHEIIDLLLIGPISCCYSKISKSNKVGSIKI